MSPIQPTNSKDSHAPRHEEEPHSSIKNYVIGFTLSILFTVIPFYVVMNNSLSKGGIVFVIFFSAAIQLIVQLWFFLHLNEEKKPFYLTQAFLFAVISLFIIIGGSLWVMYELTYYMHLA
ncbi:Cytochrome o ubiquinol oxidase subunit IV [Candidatus Hepatincolaceae symbiont of Richtersius coronifer]